MLNDSCHETVGVKHLGNEGASAVELTMFTSRVLFSAYADFPPPQPSPPFPMYMHYFTCPKWQLNILGMQHTSTQLYLPQMATVEHFRNTADTHQFHLPQMAIVEHFRHAISMHHFTCPKWQLLNTLGMQHICTHFHLPQMAIVEHSGKAACMHPVSPAPNGNC